MYFVLLFFVCRFLVSVCTDLSFYMLYVVAFHSFVHYLFENYFLTYNWAYLFAVLKRPRTGVAGGRR